MTHFDLGIAQPAAREQFSPKVIEKLMAVTVITVEAAWLVRLGYGAWRLIFG